MPVERIGPPLMDVKCPICGKVKRVSDLKRYQRIGSCEECGIEICVDKNGNLDIGQERHVRQLEKCPGCDAEWRCWFKNENLEKVHGARILTTGNTVACLKCGTIADVTFRQG